MPSPQLRALLARDGIFNTRDLGGIANQSGQVILGKRLIRADALQRVRGAGTALHEFGVVRVLDLRDDLERQKSGEISVPGITVEHHPVIDPAFAWDGEEGAEVSDLLYARYCEILGAFGSRFTGAVNSIAEVIDASDAGSPAAVAFHCAIGKDRTGLLTALLLSILGVDAPEIASDYAKSSTATAVQVQWLWSFSLPGGNATDLDLNMGVWSARPETMLRTLAWVDAEFGGGERYMMEQGLDAEVCVKLRNSLLTPMT
ncbi:MAG: tyrosine-protein phosphatase [Microthrixaceae bacterium]